MERLRMCVVCREMLAKSQLMRFVLTDGKISLDKSGKKDGRGAYLCLKDKCIDKALKTNAFAKSFKQNVDKDSLAEIIEQYVAESKS